jgi:hypothetical protein
MSVQIVARSSTMNDILNTAPVGGMTAAGQFTSYVMTRQGVVGLSLALLSEAAGSWPGWRPD